MSTRPVLRATSLDDASALAALHATCFEDAWSTAAMIEVLRAPDTFGFITTIDALPPLGLALGRVSADEAELLTIAVDGAWRRYGLARALIDAVVEAARTRGARQLFLEVAEDNIGARALYEGKSFHSVGRRRAYYARADGSAIDALTMRRDLARGWRWLLGR